MPQNELAHLELLAEVDTLVDRLNRWAEGAPAWPPAESCRALVRRLTERTASLRIRIEAPLVVATLGGTGTGKSALVNAILGTDAVQTGRARPTTMRPTLITRPGLKPEMLGIEPASVEWLECDLPALRDLALVDCPDPDTTEEEGDASAGSNLARLRAILPKCDVLLVAATQQKYRSARVTEELTAAAPGARLVFVQTHADLEDDIRDDWRRALEATCQPGPIFRVDSIRALEDAKSGMQPRGDFAELLDLLTRQMAGAASNRIRRANFLDLTADTLDACRARIDDGLSKIDEVQAAIDEQRAELSRQMAGGMQAELMTNRRQWENRLLSKSIAYWGMSPFTLVLRTYQGIGGLLAGALLYRARTPAQMALWGVLEGTRNWRKHQQDQQAERGIRQASIGGFDPSELRKASIIVEGYVAEARLDRNAARLDNVTVEAAGAADGFVHRVSNELESLVARLAKRHTGWFTRFRYEVLLLAMLGLLLFRLGKNFFYDSWFAPQPQPVFGVEFYVSAGFWLVLWCLILIGAFCIRLRRGLRGEITQLATGWQNGSIAVDIFQGVERECREIRRFCQEMDLLRQSVEQLRQRVATGHE